MADTKTIALTAVITLALAIGGFMVFGGDAEEANLNQGEAFTGHFAAVQPLQEINTGSNDLSVTQQDLPSNGTVYDTNVVSKFDVNGTDGETTRYALPLEVDGAVGQIDAEIDLLNTTAFDLRDVYVVEDTDDSSLSEEDARISLGAQVEDGELDAIIPRLADGDHAIVVELKGITTDGVSNDADLVDITLDADKEDADDDEADEVVATLDNAQ